MCRIMHAIVCRKNLNSPQNVIYDIPSLANFYHKWYSLPHLNLKIGMHVPWGREVYSSHEIFLASGSRSGWMILENCGKQLGSLRCQKNMGQLEKIDTSWYIFLS